MTSKFAPLTFHISEYIITFKELNVMATQKTKPYEQQIQIFKALTHPARLSILEILRDGEHCVCHMEAHLGLRQAYISQQLAVLREAGLIHDRRDGWNVFYRVANPHIFEVLSAMEQIAPASETAPHKHSAVPCNCPTCSGAGGKE
jgi:ArsR family transcriptional regulator